MKVKEVVELVRLVINQWTSVLETSFDHYLGFMNQADWYEHLRTPDERKIKVNTNTKFKASNCYNYSKVVRDHMGELKEAASRCIQDNIALQVTEAMRIHESLS